MLDSKMASLFGFDPFPAYRPEDDFKSKLNRNISIEDRYQYYLVNKMFTLKQLKLTMLQKCTCQNRSNKMCRRELFCTSF